ncbi:MAG: ergothioneine biosynthesis protein EgtB [Isosphaeraceae bacterium]|jgi:ergothioneine biosynthesis protein EgtB|nr:MAG: ergothioneine biosynthesis protein EgtB [Isosphaeraceae bacterium]
MPDWAAEAVASQRAELSHRYARVREQTEALCAELEPEDYMLQPVEEASPAKWHLAHTTWFFEVFVLTAARPERAPYDPSYGYLFNSYYNAVGERLPRSRRGLISRPTVAAVLAYRRAIDDEMAELLADRIDHRTAAVIELGLNHEQQHQELLVTDLKLGFWHNPTKPAVWPGVAAAVDDGSAAPPRWIEVPGGLRQIGHAGSGFAFDNEGPRHTTYVRGYRIADRPVCCGEFLAFIEDGGYDRPELWLSDGWAAARSGGWRAPLYWERDGDGWMIYTAGGIRAVDRGEPVCHVSFYEADAFARWAGARLPTEAEWEIAAVELRQGTTGPFLESGRMHPAVVADDVQPTLKAMMGGVWEWTSSPYVGYPGYRPAEGALGEYNGKFMCNQMVLRGGSCATPVSHIRPTYRNFFPPEARWQLSGLRLAQDA